MRKKLFQIHMQNITNGDRYVYLLAYARALTEPSKYLYVDHKDNVNIVLVYISAHLARELYMKNEYPDYEHNSPFHISNFDVFGKYSGYSFNIKIDKHSHNVISAWYEFYPQGWAQ